VKRAGAPATLIGCLVLGLVLVAAVIFGGAPVFTGPIWAPGLSAPSAPPMTQPPQTSGPTQPPVGRGGGGPLVMIVLAVIGALLAALVLYLVLRVIRARLRRAHPPALGSLEPAEIETSAVVEDEADAAAPVMRHGLQLALDALEEEREPSDAVVRAWLGLQEAAEISGVQRRAAETPTEFTTRVLTRVHADGGAARELVDVYQSVRFGGHPITSRDVALAHDAVTRLLASWHEPAIGRRR